MTASTIIKMARDDCPEPLSGHELAILNDMLGACSDIPSPCFVIDMAKLRANAAILAKAQEETGAKILLALKAYAAFSTFSELSRAFSGPLWGVCASSVDEARLGREEFGGEVQAFAAAWNEAEMTELLPLINHITFNSLDQWRQFQSMIGDVNAGSRRDSPVLCGFRVNPEHSEGAAPIYDPCAPGSRLGLRQAALAKATVKDWQGITGLHFHALCEQNADALSRVLDAFERKFGQWLRKCQWLNFGGGHHITRPDYDLDLLVSLLNSWRLKYDCQIYLEPGEAVALNAGFLVATVLDILESDDLGGETPIAILDISAACHMPDVLEMPYRPNVWALTGEGGEPEMGAEPEKKTCSQRLAGKSCLAGDVIGEYSFSRMLERGDRLAFADMAIYSMVKTTTFNGLRLPGIGLWDKSDALAKDGAGRDAHHGGFAMIRQFGYEDFKGRLS